MPLAAVVLVIGAVIGILYISWTYNWALAYLAVPTSDNVYSQFQSLTKNIIAARSLYSTLLIAAIYVPATGFLRSISMVLADEAKRREIALLC